MSTTISPPKPAPPDLASPKRVPKELNNRSLDAAVRALFEVSWGDARRWVRTGKVSLNGERVTQATVWVHEGQQVLVTMNARRAARGPELMPAQVVHLDSNVVVINKPAGISTIPFEEGEPGTLDELVRNYISSREKAKGTRPQLGVVHRLDKDTSGLVVFTRTWEAKRLLSNQFRVHSVKRSYLAIAHGDVRKQTFQSHLIENRGDGIRGSTESRFRGSRPTNSQGQLAITHVEPVAKLAGATLLICRLETGRTHQIRIHLSEAGHPIVGERVYIRNFDGKLLEAPRHMLHARELGFVHPVTEAEVAFTAEPPADFEAVRKGLAV